MGRKRRMNDGDMAPDAAGEWGAGFRWPVAHSPDGGTIISGWKHSRHYLKSGGMLTSRHLLESFPSLTYSHCCMSSTVFTVTEGSR